MELHARDPAEFHRQMQIYLVSIGVVPDVAAEQASAAGLAAMYAENDVACKSKLMASYFPTLFPPMTATLTYEELSDLLLKVWWEGKED